MGETSVSKETDNAAMVASARAVVGIYSATQIAREAVNEPMIRHWCEAMSDYNPVYTDAAFAAKSIHGGIVAPTAMLDTWMMPGLSPRGTQLSDAGDPVGMVPVMDKLDAAGFTAIVATNTTHEYDRYLRPGERLRVRSAVTAISPEKKTALGIGHFMTTETELSDESGKRAGRMEFRVLKFKPGTGSLPTAEDFADFGGESDQKPEQQADYNEYVPQFRPPPLEERQNTLRFETVKVGDELAPCPVPITRTQIVAGAIASRDFEPVHHDLEIAKRRGSPDIFMNIMTSGGLTSRYVTEWAGPEAIVRNMKIRLGIPNFPGDTMTFVGQVNAVEMREGVGVVEVGVRGVNQLGDHVSGTIDLALPLT
jgi:acyl dehydratase